jgi:two-component system phosphate regulon sensor histidine kinase PhoR
LRALVSNAVKFNVRGGHVTIRAVVTHDAGPRTLGRSWVNLSVEDGGRGIPAAEQARVFGRFFRAGNAVHDELEGPGLGLHVARRLAEAWGGKMWFTSAEGEGSVFHVTIPVI